MHVLWLIPDYHSFLVEEMGAVAQRVSRLTVLSQAAPWAIPNVQTITISSDVVSLTRIAARSREFARAVACCGWRTRPSDLAKVRRIARHNEVMRTLVIKEKIDVIHSHFAVPEGTCGLQAICGTPVVVTLRGVDILTLPKVDYGFMRDGFYAANLQRALGRTAAITVASRQTFEAARSILGTDNRLHLIPNGVDLERFSSVDLGKVEELRSKLGLDGRQFVLAAGNLVPGKAFDLLIRAFASIRKVHSRMNLVIAGDGAERGNLQRIAQETNTADAVLLPGRIAREDMPLYFAACDVFVHPSLSEGFGNVVLEAMALGRPIVATRTGAAADLIEDGENGLLVQPGDVSGLAVAIDRLLHDPELRARCARSATETVRHGYSMSDRVSAFIKVYGDCLTTGRIPCDEANHFTNSET